MALRTPTNRARSDHICRRRLAPLAAVVGASLGLIAVCARAQSPTPGPTLLTLYASGGANFAPAATSPSNPAGAPAPAATRTPFVPFLPSYPTKAVKPPPPPEASACAAKYTEVSFRITCQNDPTSTSANVCRGSMDFYGLNLSEIVEGPLKANPDGSFSMSLHSPEGNISDCALSTSAAAEGTTTVRLSSCRVAVNGCSGDVTGAGQDQSVSSHAFLRVEPTD